MKTKKILKIIAIAATLIAVFGLMNAMAADEIEVYVNDAQIQFDVAPQIINDRTMIPFRYVANAFGAEVDYKEEADGRKIVTAALGDKTLYLTIGDTNAVLIENGKETGLAFDVAPVIVESRTLVPVRLVGEAFGCSVGWNGDERQVVIIDSADFAERIKIAAPEFYENILCHDLTKIFGTYDIALGTDADSFNMEFTADGKAVSITLEYDAYIFDIIITPEAVYAKEVSLTGDKWELTTLEEALSQYEFDSSALTIDGQVLISTMVDSYMEGIIPTTGTYAEINAFIDMILADVAENFIIETKNDITTAAYKMTIPADGSNVTISISKATKNDTLENFTLSFVGAEMSTEANFNFSLTRTNDNANIAIPTADKIITE